MIGWTEMNYFGVFFMIFLIALSTTASLTYLKEKGHEFLAMLSFLVIMMGGMAALFGAMAAPMDSYMERDYYEAKFASEAALQTALDGLDKKMVEQLTGYSGELTCEEIDKYNRETGMLTAPCRLSIGPYTKLETVVVE